MTHVIFRDEPAGDALFQMPAAPGAGDPAAPADPAALRLRAVHRAIADLRRGTPVLLEAGAADAGSLRLEGEADGPASLVVLAAETAGARGLAEFAAMAAGAPALLLAPVRAAAVLRRPLPPEAPAVALHLPAALLDPAALRSLADPTAERMLLAEPSLATAPAAAGAAIALAKLARLLPAALVAPAHPLARRQAEAMALLGVNAADVLAYPGEMATRITRVAEATVPLSEAPDARIVAFRGPDAGIEHLAIVVGRPEQAVAPLVRIHSECFTGDLLGSLRCDCGPQLHGALRRMADDGSGVLVYLAQEGRGIGLVNKLRAYALQDRGMDTLDANRALGWGADERNFLVAATMLEELGITTIRLLTNNPDKIAALQACGLTVAREPHRFAANGVNDQYLATKAARFGHLLG